MPPKQSPVASSGEPGLQSVVIYTRVSTDNQIGGRFDSCESQAAYCREEIARHTNEGWFEVACLTDAAYSGATMDRPGMRALKRMIEAGEVKIVLIYKLERVMRSTDEWIPFRAFLKKHGCRLESATERISEDTPAGRLQNMLMMSFNTYERENTVQKTRDKMLQQAKRGIWNGGAVPYGYTYDSKAQSLNPDPQDAAVVRRIFEQAARLVSLTDLANQLNAEGLRTKQRVWRRRDGTEIEVGGRKYRSDGLRLLIRNPIYRGAVRFAGEEFSARHQPLVSRDLWELANAATAHTEPRPVYAFRERDVHNHLLKGIVWCGSCKRALVPADSGKKVKSGVKYRYYTCSLVMRETSAAPCPVGRLSADALEIAVTTLLGEVGQHPSIVAGMIARCKTAQRGDRRILRTELEEIRRTLADCDAQLRNCADAVAKRGVEALGEVLAERANELRATRQGLIAQQERKRQELALCDADLLEETRITENLRNLAKTLSHLPPAEQKELVRLFVERVEVWPAAMGKRTEAAMEEPARLLEINVKLHLPELVRDIAQSGEAIQIPTTRLERGLNLNARVDFRHVARGEITLVAPFRRSVRISARVRTVPVPKPAIVHPMIRALNWQQILDAKTVPHRFALAAKMGCTPGAVTKVLRLIKLIPEIQAFLASIKTRNALWHFSLTRMGAIAKLPPELQQTAFSAMKEKYAMSNVTVGPATSITGRANPPRLNAG